MPTTLRGHDLSMPTQSDGHGTHFGSIESFSPILSAVSTPRGVEDGALRDNPTEPRLRVVLGRAQEAEEHFVGCLLAEADVDRRVRVLVRVAHAVVKDRLDVETRALLDLDRLLQ